MEHLPHNHTPELLPHQQRVIVERGELQKKLNALNTFILKDVFKDLGTTEQRRLKMQAIAMALYCATLDQRIMDFTS